MYQAFDYEFDLVKEEIDGQIDKVGIKATTVHDLLYVKVAKLISFDHPLKESISVQPCLLCPWIKIKRTVLFYSFIYHKNSLVTASTLFLHNADMNQWNLNVLGSISTFNFDSDFFISGFISHSSNELCDGCKASKQA